MSSGIQQGDLVIVFGTSFDANAVEPQTDFQVIPAGKYPVMVEEAELRTTKAGNGKYVKLRMKVLDGEYKGMPLYDQINIANPSEKCVEIGIRCLSALCRAASIVALNDTAELVNKVVIACVKVKNDQNEIRTYEAAVANTQPAPPAPLPTTPLPSTPPVAPPTTPPVASPGGQSSYQYQPAGLPPPITAGQTATGRLPWQR